MSSMKTRPSSTAVRTDPAVSRAKVREVGGVAADAVFDVRTAYDFSISLSPDAGGGGELPEADRVWLERARASLPAALLPLMQTEHGISATGLIIDRPDVTDAASVVAMLRGLRGADFARQVLDEERRDPEHGPLLEAAAAGDDAALAELLAACPGLKRARVERLLRDPEAGLAEVIELLTAWLPIYQEIEPRVQAIIERDAALRADDRRTLRTAELVERTTSGIRWLSEPGVRRVILAPSYLVRPYNFVFSGGDWRMFVYPVADAALEPDDPLAPPPSVLRLHRALGDATRLRILRLLRDREMYLTEVAERLELSKPTIKHHLAQLRAAGLVTVVESGSMIYYSLRRDRLDDASSELRRYLS
jgi:DNA-binding transcriptional ArsR family regulator